MRPNPSNRYGPRQFQVVRRHRDIMDEARRRGVRNCGALGAAWYHELPARGVRPSRAYRVRVHALVFQDRAASR